MQQSRTDALVTISAYIMIGGEDARNLGHFAATDDPDEYASAVLGEVSPPMAPDRWRLTGGDDHGDGLTSYDYLAAVNLTELREFLDWIGQNIEDATPNMGILTGPEEYGHIPAGLSWSGDGMDWNVGGLTRLAGVDYAVFPVSEDAARICGFLEPQS